MTNELFLSFAIVTNVIPWSDERPHRFSYTTHGETRLYYAEQFSPDQGYCINVISSNTYVNEVIDGKWEKYQTNAISIGWFSNYWKWTEGDIYVSPVTWTNNIEVWNFGNGPVVRVWPLTNYNWGEYYMTNGVLKRKE